MTHPLELRVGDRVKVLDTQWEGHLLVIQYANNDMGVYVCGVNKGHDWAVLKFFCRDSLRKLPRRGVR